MRENLFDQNEHLKFCTFVCEVTGENMRIIDFLDLMFISWFEPVSGMPAKFHSCENVKKRNWSNREIMLFREYIWDNIIILQHLQEHVTKENDKQIVFATNSSVYGVLFFEALQHLSETLRRQAFNTLLSELIRVEQYILLKQLIIQYSVLVDFRVLLRALENAYSGYSEAFSPKLQLKRMEALLKILPEIHIAFSVLEHVQDHSMRAMRAEVKPTVLVRTEDNQELTKEKFVRVLQQIITIPNPCVNTFFSKEFDFIFKQFSLRDCLAWFEAPDREKMEKRLEIARALFVSELNKGVKGRSFFAKLRSHDFLHHKKLLEMPREFMLSVFDKGHDWWMADTKRILPDKKIQKALCTLSWICGGHLSLSAPISQEELRQYRASKPEAISLKKELLTKKRDRLELLIDHETRFLAAATAHFPAENALQQGNLFWHAHQSLEKYTKEKQVIEEGLVVLKL